MMRMNVARLILLKKRKWFCFLGIFVVLLCGYSEFIVTSSYFLFPPSRNCISPAQDSIKNDPIQFEAQEMNKFVHCEVNRVGCFQSKDLHSKFLLFTKHNYMTLKWCFSFCSCRSANYAALTFGDTCVCGQEVTQFAQLQYTKCQTPCSGGTGTCGGGDAVQVFRIVSPCFQGPNLSTNVATSRFLGCFRSIPDSTDDNYTRRKYLIYNECISFCDMQNLPLAIINNKSECMCGRFNKRLNVTNKVSCDQTHVKVYRTFSTDARCDNIRLLFPTNYNQTVLTSFPGSGNTWTRHLLERATGIYTGSVYGDKLL
ncbi:sialate:O-sulfotransferase 1-like [Clavelina lepadiformis]|uniref:sialate:O-sulfotransferase 1-like n=1 Tax=Clavelina lepadiformis TaxID=159417 RepID=UPI00404181BD